MIFLSIPLVVLFFILGGQFNKLYRSVGVPLSILGVYLLIHQKVWLALPSLWYAFTLTLGYGENSKLMKIFKSEQKVRIALGLLNSLPIIIMVALTMKWICLLSVIVIVAVECIRMGSWGKIGKYDILPVDIFRGLVLALAVSWVLS